MTKQPPPSANEPPSYTEATQIDLERGQDQERTPLLGQTYPGYQVVEGVSVVVQQPVIVSGQLLYCPSCNQMVYTVRETEAGCFAYSMSAFLCCVCWPLFWIPFVNRRCQERVWRCSQCDQVLASTD